MPIHLPWRRDTNDPWKRWDRISLLDVSDVPPDQLPLYAVGWLRTEINSDGFSSLFQYYAYVLPHALAAIRNAGLTDLVDLIERAMAVVGEPFPTDQEQLETALFALMDNDDPRLQALDEEYYAFEAAVDLDELMRSIAVP